MALCFRQCFRVSESCKLTTSRLFGFLTGAVVAGASVYFYVLGDYRVSNEMLSDDINVSLPRARLILRFYLPHESVFYLRVVWTETG